MQAKVGNTRLWRQARRWRFHQDKAAARSASHRLGALPAARGGLDEAPSTRAYLRGAQEWAGEEDMLTLTFPDGAQREYAPGRAHRRGRSISKSLLKKAVAVTLDGTLTDLSEPITQDAPSRS